MNDELVPAMTLVGNAEGFRGLTLWIRAELSAGKWRGVLGTSENLI